jgi:xylulokinase
MALVAGVDSSTQSCKVVIRDAASGALVRSGRASHPNGTEVPPERWWEALQAALADAGGLDDVAAISIGGQQHGMVLLDAEGRVIRDALLWNDTRSAGDAERLIAHFGAEFLAANTGSIPVASFTSTKVAWVAANEPQNAARIAAICLPHDYLSWRLAGYGPAGESQHGPDLTALATDASDASGTGYFNPNTGEYVTEILEWLLGSVPLLPRIVAPGEAAYAADAQRNGFKGLIAGGAGDNAAAGLGAGASNGDVVVSLGTSGTVFAVSATSTHDTTGTIAGFASASGSFLPLVCTLNAARVLDRFADLLSVSHAELGELALQANPGAGGVVLVPYFEGERTPNLPDATASLTGLTLSNSTRPNFARAAIEGMLSGLADGLDALVQAGVAAKRILLVGGAAANPAVQRVAAQVFGLPIVVPAPGEYVADGAARQSAWALTGNAPTWQVSNLATIELPREAVIALQYRAATGMLFS